MMHPAIEKCLEDYRTATVPRLLATGTPEFPAFMEKVCALFDNATVTGADQVLALAFILGTLWATWQGETTAFEKDNSMILTMEDRRALFDGIVEVIYRGSMEAGEAFPGAKAKAARCN